MKRPPKNRAASHEGTTRPEVCREVIAAADVAGNGASAEPAEPAITTTVAVAALVARALGATRDGDRIGFDADCQSLARLFGGRGNVIGIQLFAWHFLETTALLDPVFAVLGLVDPADDNLAKAAQRRGETCQ